jgi:ATP-dependent Zn protease
MLILTTNAAIFFSVVANSGGSSKRMDSLFMGPQFNQKVKRYGVDTNVKVKFKDVAGLEEAKF